MTDAAKPEQAEPARRIGVLVVVATVTFALDAISKVVIVAVLPNRPPIKLLGGLLTLRELRNSGAAFNLGTGSGAGMTLVFTLIAAAVVVAILRYARRLRSVPWAITLGLLLGGALGNLADRVLRSPGPLRGYVVDWIELPRWPVFNLADSAIVCGGALAVLLAYRGLQLDGTRDGEARRDKSPEGGGPGDKGPGGKHPESKHPGSMDPGSKSPGSKSPEDKDAESKAPEGMGLEGEAPQSRDPGSKGSESEAPQSRDPESKGTGSRGRESRNPGSGDPQGVARREKDQREARRGDTREEREERTR